MEGSTTYQSNHCMYVCVCFELLLNVRHVVNVNYQQITKKLLSCSCFCQFTRAVLILLANKAYYHASMG